MSAQDPIDAAISAAVALISAQAQLQNPADQVVRGGLVTSYDSTTRTANVVIDGDIDATPMSVDGSVTPAVSDRCWVTFRKPCGVFLTGLQ